jgi:hypothetical protein
MEEIFYTKYIKYKTRYLDLKHDVYHSKSIDKIKINNSSNKLNIKKIKDQINQIDENNTYVVIDLNFSEKEREHLKNFKIDRPNVYSRYGAIELMEKELPKYFEKLGNNDKKSIKVLTNMILRINNDLLEAFNKPSAWIDIRASKPNPDFDIPKWHLDGRYFEDKYTPTLKFVTTLKGPSTLLSDSKQHNIRGRIRKETNTLKLQKLFSKLREAIKDNNKEIMLDLHKKIQHENIKTRKKVAKILDKDSVHSMSNGDGAIYTTNNSLYGCLHSEPPINEERIFVSILPGTEAEIEELKKFRRIK